MGNSANCTSCGCGEKQDPTNTVHFDPNDPRFSTQPYSSSAPPPTSAAQPAGKGRAKVGDDGGPPTDRKDHPPQTCKQDSKGGSNGAESGRAGQQDDGLEHRVERLTDGSVFEGQFKGRDRCGWGKFTWATGGSYEGHFENNDMHGEGTYHWSDGSAYTGQWQRNNMGPEGTMKWTDGRKYEGQFRNGKKHGDGRLMWPDGRSYTGQWEAGKQHGTGVTVTGKGLSRKSQWEHGKLVRWLEDQGEPDVGGTMEPR